jgi:complex iron-sulfur molybdoenzyme family reductase subunit gamma
VTSRDPATLVAGATRADARSLRAPSAEEWESVAELVLRLEPTPLELLPSAYVQKAWESRARGLVGSVAVRGLVSDASLLLRLTWTAEQPRERIDDNDVYADACGVLFPLDGQWAELATMGTDERPVNAWYWRAGAASAYSVEARGLGTTVRVPDSGLVAGGEWKGARWSVVFSRPLRARGVPLSHGAELPVAFAVWSGAGAERGGIKSHTPIWQRLRIE